MNRIARIERLKILKEKRIRQARKTILSFTNYTKSDYKANWHHEIYANKLDKFMKDEIKNLMVFMPPQHGKSELSTRRVPAKMLGDNPELRIGIIAYNHTIAAGFNRNIQRIIESKEYQAIYPDTCLNGANVRTSGNFLKNSDEFEVVNHTGSLVSVGISGSLTSKKLDIAVMDDLYKDPQSAWSYTIRQTVQNWYEGVLRPRLHNRSKQLLVFTRWHEDDLAGYLLKTEPENWEVVLFEAIKTNDARDYDIREAGEVLWEEEHCLKDILKVKENSPVIFDSLYQQNPTPKEGLLFPEADLKRFKMSQLYNKDGTLIRPPDGVISVVDTADEGDDNLCQPVGLMYGDDVYIVDAIFTKDPIEITQPRSAEILDRYKVKMARYESNNGGKGFAMKVKELVRGKTIIKWKQTTSNKHTKIIMASGVIKEHFYFRDDEDIKDHKEYKDYIYNLTHYPVNGKCKHDDAADGTAMLENYASKKSSISFLK